jgi:hypothetical protein
MDGMITYGKIDGLSIYAVAAYLHAKRIPLSGYINIVTEDIGPK